MPEAAAEKETVKVIRFGEEIVPFAKIGSANLPEGLMSNTFIVKGLGRLRFIIKRIHPGSKLDTTKVFSNPYLITAEIEPENFFSLDYLKSWQRRLIEDASRVSSLKFIIDDSALATKSSRSYG